MGHAWGLAAVVMTGVAVAEPAPVGGTADLDDQARMLLESAEATTERHDVARFRRPRRRARRERVTSSGPAATPVGQVCRVVRVIDKARRLGLVHGTADLSAETRARMDEVCGSSSKGPLPYASFMYPEDVARFRDEVQALIESASLPRPSAIRLSEWIPDVEGVFEGVVGAREALKLAPVFLIQAPAAIRVQQTVDGIAPTVSLVDPPTRAGDAWLATYRISRLYHSGILRRDGVEEHGHLYGEAEASVIIGRDRGALQFTVESSATRLVASFPPQLLPLVEWVLPVVPLDFRRPDRISTRRQDQVLVDGLAKTLTRDFERFVLVQAADR